MRRSRAAAATLAVALAVAACSGGGGGGGAGRSATPVALPVAAAAPAAERQAAALVARMTLDEKISMVHGTGLPMPLYQTGYAGVIPGIKRLGIPPLYLADSPVGVGDGALGVTQWPDTTTLAASWDTDLTRQYGVASGEEQAAKGNNVLLGPTVNILRLPTWGRAPETFGEDPYLTGQEAAAEIRGIQADHVIATVKHFLANNQEVQRNSIDVRASGRALAEIYQPAFRTAVTAGDVGAVMCSYNKVGGAYACENGAELTGVLRDAWKFDGMVMSDWGATHSTVPSARAGLDLEMPGSADDAHPNAVDAVLGSYFNSALRTAVQNGSVPTRTLDTMVTRILTAMIRVGVLDHPTPNPAAVHTKDVSTDAHRRLATAIDEAGTVLLRNEKQTLPLDPRTVRSVAVVGDAADEHPRTAAGGSAEVTPSAPAVSPLAGITARLAGTGATVTHARGTLGTAALPAVPASAFGAGLHVTYYRGADLSGPALATGTVANLDIGGEPPPVGDTTDWSARYTGTITAPSTGDYRFSLQAGADVTVTIDGRKAVTYRPLYEAVQNGLVHLAAGPHAITVEVTPQPLKLVEVDKLAVAAGLHLGWQPDEDRLVAQAAAAAKRADVAVVVVSDLAAEGMDRSTLALPADQDKLVEAVAAANPRTVVVLATSGAVLMPWLSRVSAVVETWYGGQTAGTALASVLFGDADPGGRLPVTFPAADGQGPARTKAEYPGDGTTVRYDEGLLVGYRWYDAKGLRPLFPFGYGLSYTSFRFGGLSARCGGATCSVSATVTNTGRRAGSEVAQLYLGFPPAAGEPPRQLRGFQRVQLGPGASRRVTFTLDRQAFAVADASGRTWSVPSGSYGVWVGDSSAHLPLRTAVSPPTG